MPAIIERAERLDAVEGELDAAVGELDAAYMLGVERGKDLGRRIALARQAVAEENLRAAGAVPP